MKRVPILVVVAALAAFFMPSRAAAYACFGAPADYTAQFGNSWAEPRVYLEAQAWWAEKSGPDPFGSEHIHMGGCYPQGEIIQPVNGQYRFSAKLQRHNAIGAKSTKLDGFNFLSGGTMPSVALNWTPTSVDETRYATLVKSASGIPTGRRENRIRHHGFSKQGKEFFNSTGWQTYVGSVGGGLRSSDVIIARGWYQGFDYINASLPGTWKASSMDALRPGVWFVKFGIQEGATSYAVYVDPALHNGSKGQVVIEAQGGNGTRTVAVNTTNLAPGLHRLMIVANENKTAGTASGVQVIPFLVG